MPEVIFQGSEGRIEGRYHHNPDKQSPVAVILHPHPLYGGTMNNKIVYRLYSSFAKAGFSVLRFNFRGVGRSVGKFDDGIGEMTDAATALDWVQLQNPDASCCWIAGFSFGAWIFIAVADAPPGDRRLHRRLAARQHVRFRLPQPLARPPASSRRATATISSASPPSRRSSTSCVRRRAPTSNISHPRRRPLLPHADGRADGNGRGIHRPADGRDQVPPARAAGDRKRRQIPAELPSVVDGSVSASACMLRAAR